MSVEEFEPVTSHRFLWLDFSEPKTDLVMTKVAQNKAIGTKMIEYIPMTRGEYNAYRGWETPEKENKDDEGYLVEYLDSPNPNHPNHKNYISWSPKDVFDRAYRHVSGMSFGLAIEAMKMGNAVARKGWNGKGMFLYHVPGGQYNSQTDVAKKFFGPKVSYGPYIAMKTAQGDVVPWLASQTDMLADDWVVLSAVEQ